VGPSPQRKGAAFAVIIDRSKKVTFSILLRQEAEAKSNDDEIQLRSISRVEGGTKSVERGPDHRFGTPSKFDAEKTIRPARFPFYIALLEYGLLIIAIYLLPIRFAI